LLRYADTKTLLYLQGERRMDARTRSKAMTDTRREEIAVKPLEWEWFDAWTWWAETVVGKYRVEERGKQWAWTLNEADSYTHGENEESEFAAKAAAQADYERRILSAITPAPETGWRDMDSAPDWEGFGRALMEDWPTGDIDGSHLFDMSLKYGLITEVPGGYNPDEHIDAEGICPETGDPWYEYAFGTQPATEQPSVQEAARVLIAEREDHGEGLEGELAPYSLDDEGMVPDLDGDWVKLEAVTAALRSLAQGDE
jgi:hypothetical protein